MTTRNVPSFDDSLPIGTVLGAAADPVCVAYIDAESDRVNLGPCDGQAWPIFRYAPSGDDDAAPWYPALCGCLPVLVLFALLRQQRA